jgi:hypothetical protein
MATKHVPTAADREPSLARHVKDMQALLSVAVATAMVAALAIIAVALA